MVVDEDFYEQYLSPSSFPEVQSEASSNISSEMAPKLTGEEVHLPLESAIDFISFNLAKYPFISDIFHIIIIILCTIFVARLVNRIFTVHVPEIVKSNKIDFDARKEETIRNMVQRVLITTIYIIGLILVIMQIEYLNKITVTLLAGAGVATIALSFAAQGSLANIISGVFMAIFQPFRVGDYVDFNGNYSQVVDITLRHTMLCTWDGRRIIVPNSLMDSQYVINWTISDPEITWTVDVGIAYTADINKAREIMKDVAMRHPLVMKNREIWVWVTELGDFAVNMCLYVHMPHRDVAFSSGCEMRESIKKKFDEAGIEIPYPYRNLVIHGQGSDASAQKACLDEAS